MTGLVTTRFAPSPTGRLHLGHAFSALQAHDRARGAGGRFLLRIEDIDPSRARPDYVAAILEDLVWLGLTWDGAMMVQSQRTHVYAAVLERLKALGLAYPCFCTRAEIAASAAAPHGPGTLYPGTCRKSPLDPDRMRREQHAWRLDCVRAIEIAGPLDWTDEIAGRVKARPDLLGDVVLARKDAPVSYHLAVTVDDAAQGISHVLRGADLFESTHIHRLLQALLGLPTPTYRHHPLLTDDRGHRLAKRTGAPALAELRAAGVDPAVLVHELRAGPVPLGFRLPSA